MKRMKIKERSKKGYWKSVWNGRYKRRNNMCISEFRKKNYKIIFIII